MVARSASEPARLANREFAKARALPMRRATRFRVEAGNCVPLRQRSAARKGRVYVSVRLQEDAGRFCAVGALIRIHRAGLSRIGGAVGGGNCEGGTKAGRLRI